MTLPSITLVVGTDAKYLPQLKVSSPTWRKNRPEMWSWPMVLFYDRQQLSHQEMLDFVESELRHPLCQLVGWPPPTVDHTLYESQRDRMLAGHVFVPARHVHTAYFMKLDCDAVARPHKQWIDPAWFEGLPSIVAPRWGYTKGRNALPTLEAWADGIAEFVGTSRLNILQEPDQMRVGHARFCSWASYYRTDFAKMVARMCEQSVGPCRIPVPSQDTVHFYVAARLGITMKIANQKNRGWSNHPKFGSLKAQAEAIMREAEPANG